MERARLGTEHVGGSGLVYYPPEPGRWRVAVLSLALGLALTLGVAGSFALGQALGHHAPPVVTAHHAAAVRTARTANGALSTAGAPAPAAHPASPNTSPNASPARTLSDTSHSNQHASDHHGDHGDHHPKG